MGNLGKNPPFRNVRRFVQGGPIQTSVPLTSVPVPETGEGDRMVWPVHAVRQCSLGQPEYQTNSVGCSAGNRTGGRSDLAAG